MAYQVGIACYADAAAAYAAACGSQVPAWSYSSTQALLFQCSGSSSASGFVMRKTAYDLTVFPITSSSVEFLVAPTLAPCVYESFIGAGLVVVGALLAMWAAAWSIWRIKRAVDSYRGEV